MDYKTMTKNDWMSKVLELKIEIARANDSLDDLKAYLLSEKFHQDPTVQVRDVLRRLEGVALPLSLPRFTQP
jgi:hypothetical protein